jgi:hypothetical protein
LKSSVVIVPEICDTPINLSRSTNVAGMISEPLPSEM